LGANFVQSHVLHFYHLALLDYVAGPDSPPWQPSWSTDKRVTGAAAAPYIEHYLAALEQRRTAHEMAAVFGGRLPHPPTFVPGGITATPTAERIAAFRSHIAGLESFVNGPYQDDLTSLSSTYSDYYAIGRGYANLLAYGCFEQDNGALLFPRGRVTNGQGSVASVDASQILEEVTRSWYEGTTALHPSAGQTNPVHPKQNAYSWLKSPRYGTTPYEVGPLARVWVSGDYKNGVSALDRHWARWHECKKILAAMKTWLDQLQSGQSVYANYSAPDGSGAGLTEAPRGALGHWVRVAAGKIAAYQVITPTCWFASPRDAQGQRGPLEEALVGTPVLNTAQPNEVLRVVHSFDPCLACAVHVTRPSSRPRRVFSPS
jgi:hydrogenase large subunit